MSDHIALIVDGELLTGKVEEIHLIGQLTSNRCFKKRCKGLTVNVATVVQHGLGEYDLSYTFVRCSDCGHGVWLKYDILFDTYGERDEYFKTH